MLILNLTAALQALHPLVCNASKGQLCEGSNGSQLAVLMVSFFFLIVGADGIPRIADGHHGITSFVNWYYLTFKVAMMLSATVIMYLQSNVNLALGLTVPTTLMGLFCIVFFMGTCLYVSVRSEGGPFTSFAQVSLPPLASATSGELLMAPRLRCLTRRTGASSSPS